MYVIELEQLPSLLLTNERYIFEVNDFQDEVRFVCLGVVSMQS